MKKSASSEVGLDENTAATPETLCGIIMPIAGSELYDVSHWQRVRTMIAEAIKDAGFVPRMVSDADEVSVIHGSIVQNIYDNPIVVCDVSSRNPNVMFELGMRLAFDKPTIIVKDDQTAYSFDTQIIEHLPYRADLRYDDVRDFQKKLKAKIIATVAKKESDEKYSPFLRHFKHLVPQKLESKEVPVGDFILSSLEEIKQGMAEIRSRDMRFGAVGFRGNTLADDAALDEMVSILKGMGADRASDSAKQAVRRNAVTFAKRNHPGMSSANFEKLFERAWSIVNRERLKSEEERIKEMEELVARRADSVGRDVFS